MMKSSMSTLCNPLTFPLLVFDLLLYMINKISPMPWNDYNKAFTCESLHICESELGVVCLDEVFHVRPSHFKWVEFTVSGWETYNFMTSLLGYCMSTIASSFSRSNFGQDIFLCSDYGEMHCP